MSNRRRQDAARAAREKGAKARMEGFPQSANPYKQGGPWSLHPHWCAGWSLAGVPGAASHLIKKSP